jgi:hypothetical protein
MPASIILDNTFPSSEAGPSVATIFVRLCMAALIAQPACRRARNPYPAFALK